MLYLLFSVGLVELDFTFRDSLAVKFVASNINAS